MTSASTLRTDTAVAATDRAIGEFRTRKGLDGRSLCVRGTLVNKHLEYAKLTLGELFLRFFGFGNASPKALSTELACEGKWDTTLIQQINKASSGIFGLGAATRAANQSIIKTIDEYN